MSEMSLDRQNRLMWALLNTEDYWRTVAHVRKETPMTLIISTVVHRMDAITKLEDYGYSYNFAMNALFTANIRETWENVYHNIRIKYVGNDEYQFDMYERD